MAFRVGEKVFEAGTSVGRQPAVIEPFEQTLTESTAGTAIQNVVVQVLIDGEVKGQMTIPATFPGHLFVADFGTIFLEGDCNTCVSGSCEPGTINARLDSLHLEVGLGQAGPGGAPMKLLLESDDLDGTTAKAANFDYQGQTAPPVEVNEVSSARRQFVSPNGLADLQDIYDGITYLYTELYFYHSPGTVSGGVYPGQTLFKTVRFEPAVSGNVTSLTITETDIHGAKETVYEEDGGDWSLIANESERKEALTQSVSGSTRTVTREVRSGDNTLLQKTVETFTTYAWGEELTQRVEDPDGSARTSAWSYGTTSEEPEYGRLIAMVDADGHWERYTYHLDGRRHETISQFNGADMEAAANASRVVAVAYSGEDRTEIETLLGQELAVRSFERVTSGNQTIETREATTENLTLTTTTKYQAMGSITVRPDGTLAKTSMQTTVGGGLIATTDIGEANGTLDGVVDGTRTVVELDSRGHEISRQVYDIASNVLIQEDLATATDAFGRPTAVSHLDGTTETFTYGCCGLEEWTDREGVTTEYGHDAFGNIDLETRAGITTVSEYDALGRLRERYRIGSDSVSILIGGSDYDLDGRETARNTILGPITVAETGPTSGVLTRTETLTGNATRIRKTTPDGLAREISGTAEHPRKFEYGVTEVGLQFTKEIKVGDGGAETEWIKTYTDGFGRTAKVEYADSAEENYVYNAKGQLASRSDADGVTTLYAYNDRGERDTTALDINDNDEIDAGDPATIVSRSVAGNFVTETVTEASESGSVTVSEISREIDSLDRTESRYGVETTVSVTVGSGNRTEVAARADGLVVTRVATDGRLTEETVEAGSETVSSVTYEYDARGRLWKTTDARTGVTTNTYYDTDLLETVSKAGQSVEYQYNLLGQRTEEILPGTNRTISRDYRPTGELLTISGNATYPITYTYDAQGRIETMTTDTGVTTWTYDAGRGWLESKSDGVNPAVEYTYTPAGRLDMRTGSRGIVTDYDYDDGGRLESINYSDDTPDVTISSRHQRGWPETVIDAAGTHTLSYAVDGQLESDSVAAGLLGGIEVSADYDAFLRRGNFTVERNSATVVSTNRGYADARLETVSFGSDTAAYAYLADSPHIEAITFARSGNTRLTTSRTYDSLDRLDVISSVSSASLTQSSDYAYNSAGFRETLELADGTFWSYGMNDRGEVISGVRKLSGGTLLAGYEFGYSFDDIGNRLTATRNGRTGNYTPNSLNQYDERTVPGYLNVVGKADSSATVTVNTLSVTRQGEFFHRELAVDNSTDPVYPEVTVTATLGPDTAEESGHLFLPATPESFTYDADGNLTSDGRWDYTWDAENRLKSMTTRTAAIAAGAPKQRLTFQYDYAGRRISKKVEDWRSGVFIPRFNILFAYDGWNLAAEMLQTGPTIRTYAWGSDLSGGNAAGGVGGLLFIKQLPEEKTLSVSYDGNGNVVGLTDMADGASAAIYEYGPFGELIRSSGLFAKINPIRWSTKYQDEESGLVYYGYRYYNPELGRWVSQDPIGEDGGNNIYSYCLNDPLDMVDADGRAPFDSPLARFWMWLQGRPPQPYGPNAWQLGRDFVDGAQTPNRNFRSGDLMTEQLKKSRIIERRREQLRSLLRNYCKSGGSGELPAMELGNELVDVPEWRYPLEFVLGLGFNPAEAFTGSFTGGSIEIKKIDCDCCEALIAVSAFNSSNAASLTRFPPSLGGYKGGAPLSLLLGRWQSPWLSDPNFRLYSNLYPNYMGASSFLAPNPYGPNGPLNTISQTYNWDEVLSFGPCK